MPKRLNLDRLIVKLLFVVILISACTAPTPTEQISTLVVEIISTSTPTIIPVVIEPTQATPVIILLSNPNSGLELNSEVETILSEFAGQSGLLFENRQSLEISDLQENFDLVVALNPITNLAELAGAAPQTQFVALGISGLQAGANLTVIGGGGGGIEYQAFIAGYTAAVITQDWRVAVISTSDTTIGQQARQSFMVGARYFCGLCLQVYPPFYEYPLFAELPVNASPEEWRAAAITLLDRSVETVYVAPGAGDLSLLEFLAQSGVLIIGSSSPPENLSQNWVATIQPDLTSHLRDILPELLTGQAGGELPGSIILVNVNLELLSAGREEHIMSTLDELLSGYISPFEQ